jgi:hypothetical protein
MLSKKAYVKLTLQTVESYPTSNLKLLFLKLGKYLSFSNNCYRFFTKVVDLKAIYSNFDGDYKAYCDSLLSGQASERYVDLVQKCWEATGCGHSDKCTG